MFFFFFYRFSIRLISFIIDVPRPLRNEILDHSISKGLCIMRKMSQSVRNIFRDSRENITPYYSQNIPLQNYSLYMLFELKFSGKTSEEKYAASLGTKAKQIFFQIPAITLKICQKHSDSSSHIERTVNSLGEDPTNNNKCKYR